MVWRPDFQSQVENSTAVGVNQQGTGELYQYLMPGSGGDYTNFFQANPGGSVANGGIGRTFGLLQAAQNLPTPDPQWTLDGVTNFVVNPIDSQEMFISSSTGNIFSTSNDGETWFDIGLPSVFGSPGNASIALAYGAA